MSRNLLHKTKLEAFKVWLDGQGILHRPGRGHFEVLQVQVTKPFWCCVFSRLEMPEHYTVDRRLDHTVRQFITEEKQCEHP